MHLRGFDVAVSVSCNAGSSKHLQDAPFVFCYWLVILLVLILCRAPNTPEQT